PVMWRWEKWFFGSAIVLLTLTAGLSYWLRDLDGGPWWLRPALLTCAVLILIVAVLWAAMRLRWRRRVKAADFEACLNCGSVLKGLQARQCCPQCGEPYDLYEVKLEWHRAMSEWP
ncbi:MAG TPA: hypothetical protein VMV94_18620, partial [Phycisphaerae bacterium]|nr:hypothetical protein [Phycisphaerae bacterium]